MKIFHNKKLLFFLTELSHCWNELLIFCRKYMMSNFELPNAKCQMSTPLITLSDNAIHKAI